MIENYIPKQRYPFNSFFFSLVWKQGKGLILSLILKQSKMSASLEEADRAGDIKPLKVKRKSQLLDCEQSQYKMPSTLVNHWQHMYLFSCSCRSVPVSTVLPCRPRDYKTKTFYVIKCKEIYANLAADIRIKILK